MTAAEMAGAAKAPEGKIRKLTIYPPSGQPIVVKAEEAIVILTMLEPGQLAVAVQWKKDESWSKWCGVPFRFDQDPPSPLVTV